MNRHSLVIYLLVFWALASFIGCSKTVLLQSRASVSYFTTNASQSPYYGDSVLYVQGNTPEANLLRPVNSLGSGHYVSWPEGLSIDAQTGVINAATSEPGARYNVGFVSDATRDTAYSQVVLAGLSYQNRLYVVGDADSVAVPYYNADLSTMNGMGGHANPEFYLGSGDNGQINVNTLVSGGLFGEKPANGDVRQLKVMYHLNDRVGLGTQTTMLTVHYYSTVADVPNSLMQSLGLGSKAPTAAQVMGGATPTKPGPPPVTVDGGTAKAVPAPVTPRPPQIVIVNKGH